MSKIVQGIYRNVEGKRFDVIGVASLVEHADSGHELVIYRAIDGTRRLLACPWTVFTGIVSTDGNGKDIRRFTMVQSNQEGPR